MRIERYYSSLREDKSPLSDDANELLESQDYIGFFHACGPNYVRGIRRAQEVSAVFEFESTSSTEARAYSTHVASYHSRGWWRWKSRSSTVRQRNTSSYITRTSQSLRITIKGFGIGLNQMGSDTLVATSLEEFSMVMKFAFRAMTQNQESYHIGQVMGIEIVPWVDNIAFQVAVGMQDNNLQIPLPRSLLHRAILIDRNDTTTIFANNNATRTLFGCKNPAHQIDKYGYCCDANTLYDYSAREYDDNDPQICICKPLRTLDKSVAKNNIASNAEFVVRLDQITRLKLNQMSTLEMCISAVHAIPKQYNFNILAPQDPIELDSTFKENFILKELRLAIDPLNDYGMVRHLGKEMDEWVDMYYQPCIASIFGTNVGDNSETDPTYFAAYPWYTHDACAFMSCLGSNMRWDRKDGGCVQGLMTGLISAEYKDNEDTKCTRTDEGGVIENCKYKQSDLQTFRTNATTVWNTLPSFQISHIMRHFCLPDITEETLDYEFVNLRNQNMCIDLEHWNVHKRIITFRCHGGNNQRFSTDDLGRLHIRSNDDYCIDFGAAAVKGTKAFLSPCSSSTSQQWIFEPSLQIKNKMHNLYLGVTSGCDGVGSVDELEAQELFCGAQQMWRVKRVG